MNKKIWRLMAAAMMPAAVLSACSENDEPAPIGGEETTDGKYVFATQATSTGGNTVNLLVTGESLDEGELSVVNNGLKNDGATQWEFYKNYLYALQYNQGNAGTTRSYYLDSNGNVKARDKEFRISRFSSYGAYDDDIITMSTGDGPEAYADSHGYRPQTLLITYLNVFNETSKTNDTSTGEYSMENFLGNGEYVTLSGAEQSGSKLFCGAIPMGLSQYGSAYENGKWIRPGFEHLVKTEDGGTGSGAYKAGQLSGTQYPDECWVAIYDNAEMLHPTLAKTDKISTPCGRYRSQYYQTIWAAENGDIYVFSPSYAKTMTDKLQQTTLPAGVCRITKGSTKFDDSYYCNLEAQTTGGNRSFMRCWPAGGNSFLMVMYDRPLTEKNPAAIELAIFDATAKKLTYVTGLPANVSSFGKTVYTANGKVYIPVNVENEHPTIYGVNTSTAVATKGVSIDGDAVNGFGYMTPID